MVGRAVRDEIGPLALVSSRVMVAALFFAFLMRLRGERWRQEGVEPREWALLAAMGLTGSVGFQVLQYSALHYTNAANVGIINGAAPVATLLLALLILKERFGALQLAGAGISFCGVALLVSGGSWETLLALEPNKGDLLALVAVVAWGLFSVIGKIMLRRRPTLWVTAVSIAMAVPMSALPAAFEVASTPPLISLGLVAAIGYVGIGPACLAFLSWNEGVRVLGPSGAMAFINTLPLFTVVLAALLLGEFPGASALMGALLIIPGCLLAALGAPRSR